MHGGKLIGRGGHGFVHHPAILCGKNPQIDGKTIDRDGYVSKATIMEEALTEYVVAEIIKSNIDLENKKYFVLPISEPCTIQPGTELESGDYNYKGQNIITNDMFMGAWLSHLPYGGLNGYSHIQKQHAINENNMLIWYKVLDTIKTNLLDAFKNGLLPLNEKEIFHGDLKLENILIDDDNNVRFTDWGISIVPLEMVNKVELSDDLIAKIPPFLRRLQNIIKRCQINKNKVSKRTEEEYQKTEEEYQKNLNDINEWLIYQDNEGLKKKAREKVKKEIQYSCLGENTPLRKELFKWAKQEKDIKILMLVAKTLQIALAYKPDNLCKEIDERKNKENEDKEFDIWGLVMIFGEILRYYHDMLLYHTRIQISEAIITLYKDSSNTNKILKALENIQFTSGREDAIKKEDLDVINKKFLENLDTRFGKDALEKITEFNNTCTEYSLLLECEDIKALDTLHLTLKGIKSKEVKYEIDYLYYQSGFSDNSIEVSCVEEVNSGGYDHDLLISVIVLVVPSLFKGASNIITFKVDDSDSEFENDYVKVDDSDSEFENDYVKVLKVFQENGLEIRDKTTYMITIEENTRTKATKIFETAKKELCPTAAPIAAPPTGGKRRTTKRKTRRSRRRKSSHRKSKRHRRHRRHSRRRNVRTRR